LVVRWAKLVKTVASSFTIATWSFSRGQTTSTSPINVIRAGAAGSTNSTTGSTFFFLRAKREKNRSRKNAFAEFLPGGQEFGVAWLKKMKKSDFVMATSGVLEYNQHFKYPKFSPVAQIK